MRIMLSIGTALALALAYAPYLFADVAAAKDYVKQADDLSGSGNSSDLEDATKKLELAETELDGADAASKAAVEASIKTVKDKLAASTIKMWTPKYTRKLDSALTDTEGAIGNIVTWKGYEDAFNELQADPMAKQVLGDKLTAAAKKFATFKKLHTKKAGAIYAEQAEGMLKSLEEEWTEAKKEIADADTSPNARSSEIDKIERSIAETRRRIGEWPMDEEHTKAVAARIDKIAGEFTTLALADRVKEVVATLNRQIDLYKNDWDGYEAEAAGPTWEQFRGETSEKMSKFLAPKTAIFIERTDSFLANLKNDKDYQSVQADKTVKAVIDGAKAKRDAAYAKMLKFITPVYEAAGKAPAKDDNKVQNLKDSIRLSLGEKSPEGLEMQAALEKRLTMNVAAATGAEDAKVKLAQTLHAKAEAEWAKLYEGIPFVVEFDMNNPAALTGKNIGFLADNLMGYRFKPGDYYFATTLGGVPVAGKIDPQLMKQIMATEKAIGRGLGDNDDDGKWDCIAVVTDKKVKLMAKRQAESTATVNGTDIKVTTDYAEPVDAIVIEIIAAKCGPFAGVKDHGVLKEDGTIGK